MRAEVTNDIRTIFNAPDRPMAETYLKKAVEKYAKSASQLADWLEANIPEGLIESGIIYVPSFEVGIWYYKKHLEQF